MFIDPKDTTRNIDELEAVIKKSPIEMPAMDNRRVSGVDGHNKRCRYLWEVHNEGKVLLPAMDVTTLNEEGKIVQIDGFFGPFPEKKNKHIKLTDLQPATGSVACR